MASATEDVRLQPKLDRPMSMFDAPFFAMRHGVMKALKADTRWVVWCYLTTRLPNVFPSQLEIARETGRSQESVKRAVRELEQVGLLRRQHRPNAGAKHDTTVYHLADIRRPEVVAQIVTAIEAKENNAKHRGALNTPREGVTYDPQGGGHTRPPLGVTSAPHRGSPMTPEEGNGKKATGRRQEEDPATAAPGRVLCPSGNAPATQEGCRPEATTQTAPPAQDPVAPPIAHSAAVALECNTPKAQRGLTTIEATIKLSGAPTFTP